MNRRDIKTVSNALKATKPDVENAEAFAQWSKDVSAIASQVGEDNANFDATRFLKGLWIVE